MNDKNKRNEVFDLVRGIAIILVVIGHSGCPNYLRNLIYLFHMPVFYFISGYFFSKHRNIEIVPFIRRKIYTLYRPFIIYEFIFLILSGLFFQLQLTQEVITLKSVISKSINILIFKNSFTLLPFWFLRSLFIINVIFLFQYIFVQKLKLNSYLLLIINTLLFIIGSYLCMKEMHQPLELQREFILLYFFTLGYYFTPPYEKSIKKYNIIKLLILIICAFSLKVDLAYSIISNPILLLICSICGITLLIELCEYLNKKQTASINIIKRILCLCGKYSLTIFALHLLSFKLISLLIIKIHNLSIDNLSSFPTIDHPYSGWWIAYSIVGTAIPLFLNMLYHKFKAIHNEQSSTNRND